MIQGGPPFNKNFTPGHEYMGTVVALGPGVDEFAIADRVTVEIHAGCGQCKRCRMGMYTSCLNYGLNYGEVDKGHRANGFTTDGGFAEFAVNNINTLIKISDEMSDEEATLVVTAGTAMYGLTELGGFVAGESVVVIGPGPIGLLGAAVAKALGAAPGDSDRHPRQPFADRARARAPITSSTSPARIPWRPCAGSTAARASTTWSNARAPRTPSTRPGACSTGAAKMCLAAFPHDPALVDIAHLVRNNIYIYGIRGEGRSATHRAQAFMAAKRFDATKIHTHTFLMEDLPTALRYARDRVEDAIKVVVKMPRRASKPAC